MKPFFFMLLFLLGLFLIPIESYAQEENGIEVEESAEVYLEAYSDQFQENFFEALKQKGIENYDRAINLLLECKKLDPSNVVVDHELAKAYLAYKQYIPAQDYALETLIADPANYWYLETLLQILEKQGNSVDMIQSSIPFDNNGLKENLTMLYFKRKNFEDAKKILNQVQTPSFKKEMLSKINDSIEKAEEKTPEESVSSFDEGEMSEVEKYRSRIEQLIDTDSISELQELSEDALEKYPTQLYFYYARGHALNKQSKFMEAIAILESALDYLLDDVALNNKIYQELVNAYSALNNTSKANMYLRKIKPGF